MKILNIRTIIIAICVMCAINIVYAQNKPKGPPPIGWITDSLRGIKWNMSRQQATELLKGFHLDYDGADVGTIGNGTIYYDSDLRVKNLQLWFKDDKLYQVTFDSLPGQSKTFKDKIISVRGKPFTTKGPERVLDGKRETYEWIDSATFFTLCYDFDNRDDRYNQSGVIIIGWKYASKVFDQEDYYEDVWRTFRDKWISEHN